MKKFNFQWWSLSLALLFTSCATLPKQNFTLANMPISENLQKMVGTFEVAPATVFEVIKDFSSLNPYENKGKKDSNYYLKIEVIKNNEITFSFLENNSLIFKNKIPFTIRKARYLYLKNKNFKIDKIPMLFGGYFINRNQFSLTKTGNLNYDHAEKNYWGFLILFSSGYNSKYSKNFKRIK